MQVSLPIRHAEFKVYSFLALKFLHEVIPLSQPFRQIGSGESQAEIDVVETVVFGRREQQDVLPCQQLGAKHGSHSAEAVRGRRGRQPFQCYDQRTVLAYFDESGGARGVARKNEILAVFVEEVVEESDVVGYQLFVGFDDAAHVSAEVGAK